MRRLDFEYSERKPFLETPRGKKLNARDDERGLYILFIFSLTIVLVEGHEKKVKQNTV